MAEKKGRVLCVDDEPNILRSLQWLLQREFDVRTAPSGVDGLAVIKQGDFDVVISDQRMPGMMGSEFLREVRKVSPRSMRILLTGYSDLQSILRSVNESEVFRFISKPWNITELPRVVAEAARIAQTHPADSVPTEADEAALAAALGEQILVIDDDPSMAVVLTQAMGEKTKITHARNLAEAIAAFDNADIGIVLSDTQVANADTTVLLKVLKRDHPGIVTVVYTAAADAVDVITLINQGQIFRFIPKPVKPVTLKLALIAAMIKRKELKQNPLAAKRYGVEDVSEGAKESLLRHIESSAPATAGAEQVNTSMLQKIGVSFKRLFGGG